MQENSNTHVSLYVVRVADGRYFGGFDPVKGRANIVDDVRLGKKFTNKYDIKLRPDESLVEMTVDLSKSDVTLSEPFRPIRRSKAS